MRRVDVPSIYAYNFSQLKETVRAFERDPANRYTYCVRSVAVYECLSYARGGTIRRHHQRVTAHGTAFAYRHQGDETLLLTNQHVADWPEVTDQRNPANDVPPGCKRISATLKIVDNDDDSYAVDDVPLTRVLSDESLDVAVLKAKGQLHLMPYRVGSSAALRPGDVVMVRGFPLGVFQAVNTGTVTNPYDYDQYKDWDHVDFIVDAPLSSGNSGSPVFALNQRTGEYELVGIYHAGYTGGAALNAVIGIDQVRELMTTLKRPARPREAVARSPADLRADLERALEQPGFVPYVALGPSPVRISRGPSGFRFEVFTRRFPLDDRRLLVLAERAESSAGETLARLWFGNDRGVKGYEPTALPEEARRQAEVVLQRIYSLVASTLRYRELGRQMASARPAAAERDRLGRALGREATGDVDLAQELGELAERLGPTPSDAPLALEQALAEWERSAEPALRAVAGPAP